MSGVERSIRGSQGSVLGAGVAELSETNTSTGNLTWLLYRYRNNNNIIIMILYSYKLLFLKLVIS